MRLYELKTLSPHENDLRHLGEWDAISRQMWKHGLEEVGSGRLGRVFAHPTRDIVIKVFKTADTTYKRWVDYSKANQSNPYCPRVGNVVKISRRYSFVRIETLQPLETEEENQFFIACNNYVNGWKNHSEPPASFNLNDRNLKQVLDWIAAFEYPDITFDNIMKRGDQYVFTDPV